MVFLGLHQRVVSFWQSQYHSVSTHSACQLPRSGNRKSESGSLRKKSLSSEKKRAWRPPAVTGCTFFESTFPSGWTQAWYVSCLPRNRLTSIGWEIFRVAFTAKRLITSEGFLTHLKRNAREGSPILRSFNSGWLFKTMLITDCTKSTEQSDI